MLVTINYKIMNYKLDNDKQVFFYEQEFYVLSNFSSFNLKWKGKTFNTSEAAYHWEKFPGISNWLIRRKILKAPSAHEAFRIAQRYKEYRRPDWDKIKLDVMREILYAKVEQHEYVKKKLLETNDRELIEDSWRDDIWGWGPNKNGLNLLGRLWMEIRQQIKRDE